MSPVIWAKSRSKRMPDRSLVKAAVDGVSIEGSLNRGDFSPRTLLGRRLLEIRSRSADPVNQMVWEDLERELVSRRGG
jgi:hypothetical protein